MSSGSSDAAVRPYASRTMKSSPIRALVRQLTSTAMALSAALAADGAWAQASTTQPADARIISANAGPQAAPKSAPAASEKPPIPSVSIPFAEIGAKAGAEYKGDGIGITATKVGARLRTEFQKLEAEATPEGLWLISTSEEEGGGRLRLVASQVGRDAGGGALSASGRVVVRGKSVRLERPGLVEEYSVSVDGVRQDFIVDTRPAGEGALRVDLALTGATAEAAGGAARLRLTKSGRVLAYNRLQVTDATGRMLGASMEVTAPDALTITVQDQSAVYPVRIDPTFSDADWVSLTPGAVIAGANGAIYAMAVLGTDIYAGGDFSLIGAVATRNIAKWNGSSWAPLGTATQNGSNSYVFAIAALSASEVYVGGSFTMVADSAAASISANRIAKWNGTANTWSPLGTAAQNGTNSNVYAIAALSASEVYLGGYFTTVADSTAASISANRIAKWNDTTSTWARLGTATQNGTGSDVRAIAALSASEVYVGGSFTTVADSTATSISVNRIAKWNGTTSTWSRLGTATQNGVTSVGSEVNAIAALSASEVYVGGYFPTVADSTAASISANSVAKWNGMTNTWSPLGTATQNGVMFSRVSAIAALSASEVYVGGSFIAVADSTSTFKTASSIAKWNNTTNTWSRVGTQSQNGTNGGVNAIAALSASEVYVGGYFATVADSTAASISASNIAKWNGTTSTWTPTPASSGFNGPVSAATVVGTDLYVGGAFTAIGALSANRVAKWDGSVWSPLGTATQNGTGNDVRAIAALSASEVYVGGAFTTVADSTAASISANRIAKWNAMTSTWSPLGTPPQNGTNTLVYAIAALSASEVYVGGAFTTVADSTAASITANRIAKWNATTSTWSPLGTAAQNGTNSFVLAIAALSASEVYVGGGLTTVADSTAASITANSIAKWNGTTNTWSRLGTATQNGMTSPGTQVYAIAALSASEVYAGGIFTTVADSTAASVSASNIAKWNGMTSTWSRLGTATQNGTNSFVRAIAALSASEVYVGGAFTTVADSTAASISANHVARWNPTTNRWLPLGGGVQQAVNALAHDGQGRLFVAGSFVTAGTNPVIASPNVVQASLVPKIALEQPAGTNRTSGATIDYSIVNLGSSSAAKTFMVKNLGDARLTIATPVVTGGDAASFAVDAAGTLLNLIPEEQTTFTVTLTGAGARSTTLRIASNDSDENPFDLPLTGTGLTFTTDTDGDSLNDATEFNLSTLGFDWQVSQPALVSTLFNNIGGAQTNLNAAGYFSPSQQSALNAQGYFTTAQVQALNVGVPLLQKNPTTGIFTLTIGVEKSTTLAPGSFMLFPFTSPQTTINGHGKLEFQFTVPDNAVFFRLQSQ